MAERTWDAGQAMRTLVELGAAGWPLGLTLAVLLGGHRMREARRRAALNGALHELRRPLQVLALAPTTVREPACPGVADLALAALDDLDREINGSPRALAPRPVACRALVESALERWRGPAADARRSLELRWRAGAAMAMVDPCRVAQALDNLLANAIEHGGLRVWMEAEICARGVRISVSNAAFRVPVQGGRARRNGRRGHGLRVVAAIAVAHGGRFVVRRSTGTWVAILELPLADLPVPAAEAALAGRASGAGKQLVAAA
jgi:histidine kinase/DNA gyrase B/HSP90-like ATPase